MIYKLKDLNIELLKNYVQHKDLHSKICDWENKMNIAFLELGQNHFDAEMKNYGLLNSSWLLVFDWVETQGYCEFKHVKDSSDMMYYEEGCSLYKMIPFVNKESTKNNFYENIFDNDAIKVLEEIGYKLNKDRIPVLKTHSLNDGSAFLKCASKTMQSILDMPDKSKLNYDNGMKYAISSVGGFNIMYDFSSSKQKKDENFNLKVLFSDDSVYADFFMNKKEFLGLKKFIDKMDKEYLAAYNKRIDCWNNTITEYIVSDDDITELKDLVKYKEDSKSFSTEYRKRLKDLAKKEEEGSCKVIKMKGSEYHEMHGWYFYKEKIRPDIWSENSLEKMAGKIENILDDYPSFKVYSLWQKTKGMKIEERLKYLEDDKNKEILFA